ncbi:MAG TPA: MFS transporter [Actinomycetota bacterium]|jgi:MFS family permease|nr:MFS transporter [Actinomycetota bacterium]
MSLFRRRDFLLVFTSFALSSFGDYLALLALTIRVHDSTGSGWAVSALLLTGLLPLVAFAPLGGLLVDRMETVRVLAVAALAQAIVAVGLAMTGALVPTLVLTFLLGIGFAFTQPALFALVPKVAGQENTTQANAFLEVARWGGSTIGPFAAGTLTATIGSGGALLIDAGTFFIVAAAAVALRARRPPVPAAEAEPGGPKPREAREGFSFLVRDHLLGMVVLVTAAMVLFAAIDNVAEVFFAKDVLGAGDTGYGVLVGSWTLGMVVAATVIARRVPALRLALSVLLAAVVGGSAVAFAASLPSVPLALSMWFIGGGANGMENVGLRSLIHHRVPERIQGRVFAAYYAVINGASIGATVLGGALVALAGARGSLLTAGLGGLGAGVIGLLWYARLRSREPAVLVSGPSGSTGPADRPVPEAAPGS